MSGCLSRRSGLGALAAAFAILLASCGGGSSSAVSTLPPLHPNRVGPETIFTPANELVINPVGAFDELRLLGVDTVHVYMHWADIAPAPGSFKKPTFDATDPNAYPAAGWAVYDTIVRDAKARGIGVMLDLVPPPPDWAEGTGAPHPAKQPEWRPSASEFKQFVEAVGTRYSGHYVPPGSSTPLPRVHLWSIWNEPNQGIELAPEVRDHTQIEVAPMLYRGIVNAMWTALHATGHGGDTILIGEVAPAGVKTGPVGLFNSMPPLRFLRALYCVDSSYRPLQGAAAAERGCPTTAVGSKAFAAQNPGLFHASGFADHPYTFTSLPPNVRTPDEPDYTELAAIPTLEVTLDRLQQLYDSNTQFPIWSTEFGYITNPPNNQYTITPAQAAYYLNWSEYITWLNPRIVSFDQYLLADGPGDMAFATGLLFANGQPKPGYAAFRMPIFLPVTTTASDHPLEVWGCVRPAHDAWLQSRKAQQVQIQFQSASGGAFKTVAAVPIADRYGYFDVDETFSGSGNVRLAWTYPDGAEVFSRTVAVTLH